MGDKRNPDHHVAKTVRGAIVSQPGPPGNGQAAHSREALELTNLGLELARLKGEALSPRSCAPGNGRGEKNFLDLQKLRRQDVSEQEKSALELKKLRREDTNGDEKNALDLQKLRRQDVYEEEKNELELKKLRRDETNGAEKSALELQKLRDEAKNAHGSRTFEFLKVAVPALAIAGSLYASAINIGYQQSKDRATEISAQLVQFNDKIIDKGNRNKQRNAIATVRSLGVHAIPSLVANFDLDYSAEILAALKAAILQLNENPDLQAPISQELLSAIKYVVVRGLPRDQKADVARDQKIDVDGVQQYVELWLDCLRAYRVTQADGFAAAQERGHKLADELTNEVSARLGGPPANSDEFNRIINQLRSAR